MARDRGSALVSAPRLETGNLVLRSWRHEDLGPFAALCADPDVMRWAVGGRTLSHAESAAAMAAANEGWRSRGYGLFALEHRDSGAFCGYCGLSPTNYLPAVMPAAEIDCRLQPSFWGRGLASEAADRVLRFAFEDLALERVLSVYQPSDAQSRHVTEKLGTRLWLATTDPASKRPLRVCALTRPAWLARQPGFHHADESQEYFFAEGCYILELLNDRAQPGTSIARARVPCGTTTRWHRLQGITEHYVILDGEGRVEVGNAPPRNVGPGDVVRIPPMVRQRITSIGAIDLVFMAVCTPRFDPGRYLHA